MSSKLSNQEIVHEGWLTKSPPYKRLWRGRWRRRWFVLHHSGELPEQYFLTYYTDNSRKTQKGQIDLDECEQVDAGLHFEDSKQKYQHMFDVRTPKRVYYLAAESEADMNKWVECVCRVCGLKAEGDLGLEESPPVSPCSTASGPYIPISECTSGKPWAGYSNLAEAYDSPRRLRPASPPRSPDADSVFSDDGSSGGSRPWDDAPPRPPKPDAAPPLYSNVDPARWHSADTLDSTYDCPRRHPRPEVFRYDLGPLVDRELKPRSGGPSVDRRLKPADEVRGRAAELQYLDLDHDAAPRAIPPARSPPHHSPAPTVYKTVDFVKTEAFNRTKQNLELERKHTADHVH